MQNRIASLFELDELLSGRSNGHNGHTRPAKPKRARKAPGAPNATHAKPAPSPYAPAKKRRRRASGSAPIAQSFDTGSPIRCEHSVPYQPVPPVQVPDESLASPPAMASALDVGDEYTVEAFEEEEEEEDDDVGQISEAEVEISLDDTSAAQSAPYSPNAYGASTRANYEPAQPATFAAQMSAVERDLAELANRVQTPAPPSTPAPAPEQTDEAPAPAAQPHKPPAAGHGVFDAMAHGMSYATEFRLPPVKIAEVFSALDRQLDVEEVQEVRVPAALVRPVERTIVTVPPNVEPLPPNDVLIKDLVGLTPQGGEPAPAPVLAAAAIDVRHDVQLVPQLTGFSCWAAGAAMLVGWREKMSIDPSEIARATGYWAQYAAGLNAEDVKMFKVWGLTPEAAQSYTVQGFADLLKKHGPLWVASAEPGPHIRVVTGIVGDGTATGTLVYINDPWEQGMTAFKPSNRGSRYTETYQRFVEKQETLGRQEIKLQGIYVAHN